MRRGAGVLKGLMRAIGMGLLLCIMVLAAYQGLGYTLIGQIYRFTDDLAELISQQTGLGVSIVDLQGEWQEFDPVFNLAGVTIEVPANNAAGESQESQALVLDSLVIIPDVFGSLWARKLVVREIRVGSLVVDLGILSQLPPREDVVETKPSDEAPVWLQELGRLAIPKMAFDDILIRLPEPHVKDTFWKLSDLTIRKEGYHFTGSGSLRNQRGDVELATARLDVGLRGGVERIGGQVYLEWESGNFLLPVNTFIESEGLRIDDLQSSGKLWLKLKKGRIQQVTAEARLDNLTWRKVLEAQKPLDHFDFRMQLQRGQDPGQWRMLMDQFSLKWGESGISNAKVRIDQNGEQTDVSWDRLDVGLLVNLFQVVGIGPAGLRNALSAYRPSGFADSGLLTLGRQGEPFQLVANLTDFKVEAVDGAPAGQNIQGWIQVNSRMGEVIFAGRDPFLHFPQLYTDGWRFGYGEGRVYWNVYDDATEVIGENLLFMEPDTKAGQLTGDFSLWIPSEPGTANDFGLSLGVIETDATLAPSFVPDKLTSPDFSHWMDESIRGGTITLGGYQYAGLIGKAAPSGSNVSQMFFDVDQGLLRFHPDWPELGQFSGQIAMRNGEMSTTIREGVMGPMALNGPAQLSLSTGDEVPRLIIETTQRIEQDTLDFWLRHTPVSRVVGNAFEGWTISGGTDVSLKVAVPLGGNEPVSTDMSIFLRQAGLQLASPAVKCEKLNGRFGYRSIAGVKGSATGECLGEAVTIGLGTLGWQPGKEKIQLQVESALGLPLLQQQTGMTNLGDILGGQTQGRLEMNIPLGQGEHSLIVRTALDGLAINLPPPFGKLDQQQTPLVFSGAWQDDPSNSDWTLDWPGRLQMKFQIQDGVFKRGMLGLGGISSAEYATDGLWVEGQLGELNVNQWSSLLNDLTGGETAAEASQPDADSTRVSLPPWFAGAVVQIERLILSDYTFPKTRVGVMPHPDQVQVLLSNDAGLEGEILLPEKTADLPSANFERLYLPESVASREGGMSPADVPRARVDIKDLRLGNKTLGHWSWVAESRADGVIFNSLDGRVKGGRIKGRISWLEEPGSGQQTTILTGGVTGTAFHTFYEQWTEGKAPLTSKSFNADAGIVWTGGPADFAWKNVNGQIGFSMKEGAFRETSRSADLFRIFGILNTDAIVRRLQLDFSDLYEQGLAYDQLEGRARIQEGVVSFESPLAIQAPSSGFKLTGKTSLVDDSLDMKLVVVLPVTQNLPLAALLVGAPTVGGALFLIDKLLGDPLSKLTSATYQIKGTLQTPEVTLDRLLQ